MLISKLDSPKPNPLRSGRSTPVTSAKWRREKLCSSPLAGYTRYSPPLIPSCLGGTSCTATASTSSSSQCAGNCCRIVQQITLKHKMKIVFFITLHFILYIFLLPTSMKCKFLITLDLCNCVWFISASSGSMRWSRRCSLLRSSAFLITKSCVGTLVGSCCWSCVPRLRRPRSCCRAQGRCMLPSGNGRTR